MMKILELTLSEITITFTDLKFHMPKHTLLNSLTQLLSVDSGTTTKKGPLFCLYSIK